MKARSRSIERAARAEPWKPAYERADVADSFVDPEMRRAVPRQPSRTVANRMCSHRLRPGADGLVARSRRGRVDEARRASPNSRAVDSTSYMGQKTSSAHGAYIAVVSESVEARVGRRRRASTRRRSKVRTRWAHVAELLADANGPAEEFGPRSGGSGDLAVERHFRRGPRLSKTRRARRADIRRSGTRRSHFTRDDGDSPFVESSMRPSLGSGLPAARLLEGIGDRSDIARLRGFAKRQRKLRGASDLGRATAKTVGGPRRRRRPRPSGDC